MKILGYILFGLGAAAALGMIATPFDRDEDLLKIQHIHYRLIVLFVGIVLAKLGRWIVIKSKVSSQKNISNEVTFNQLGELTLEGNVVNSFVLYLRAFNSDVEYTKVPSHESIYAILAQIASIEEQLVMALKSAGLVISVRSPENKNPSPGAIKFFLNSKNWKEEVQFLIENARLVIVNAGLTPGLQWEVEQCINYSNRKKIVFVIYPKRTGSNSFLKVLDERLNTDYASLLKPAPLTEIPFFISFDELNNPKIYYPQLPNKFKQSIWRSFLPYFIYGFEKIFKQNNIPWEPMKGGFLQELGFAIVIGIFGIFALGLLLMGIGALSEILNSISWTF